MELKLSFYQNDCCVFKSFYTKMEKILKLNKNIENGNVLNGNSSIKIVKLSIVR